MAARKKPTGAASPDLDVASVDLGDLAASLQETIQEDPQPTNDIFLLDALKLAQFEKAGVDPNVVEISVVLHDTQKGRISIPGRYPIESMTLEEVARRWGPGIYEIRGYNSSKRAVAYARHQLRGVAPSPVPRAQATAMHEAGAASSSAEGGSFEQQLMRMLLLKMVEGFAGGPNPGAVDPMRDTMAQMVKMMAMQQQMALTSLQAQQTLNQQNAAPREAMQDRFLALVEKSIAGGKGSAPGGFAEALPVLQLGMSLGQRMAGGAPAVAAEDGSKPPAWLEVVPEIADTVGVPLIVSLAQAFLPPEKAQQVLEAIGEHSKARQAEAKAQEANGGDGGPSGPHVDLG
jgi:hypothetical protein